MGGSAGGQGAEVGLGSRREAPGDGYRHELVVRWSDCDPAGRAYYPGYFSFFEAAFGDFLASCGIAWRDLVENQGFTLPRVEVRCRYLASAAWGDRVAVLLFRRELRPRIAILAFRVERPGQGEGGAQRLAEGEVRFAVVPVPAPGRERRAVEIPEGLRAALERLPVWPEAAGGEDGRAT